MPVLYTDERYDVQTENKEQLQTTTLPEVKKAEGGSSCTEAALKLAALVAGLD